MEHECSVSSLIIDKYDDLRFSYSPSPSSNNTVQSALAI